MIEIIKRFLFGQYWLVYYTADIVKNDIVNRNNQRGEGYLVIRTSETGNKLIDYALLQIKNELRDEPEFNKILINNICKLE